MNELRFNYLGSNNKTIEVSGTKFFFDTNFAGDPRKDHFNSNERKGTIVIPEELGLDLIDDGYTTVKPTRPSQKMIDEGRVNEFVQEYIVPIKVAFRDRFGTPLKWPPKVYLITEEGNDVLLDEESVGSIDDIWISNVNVILTKRYDVRGNTLYVKSMEVFQRSNDDPIAARHRARRVMNESEEVPFV